jgi:polygalacturonase
LLLDKGCTLKMLPIDRYPGGTQSPSPFISGSDLHDISITGDGAIEGQGEKWWPLVKGPQALNAGFVRRPIMISIRRSARVLIEGVHLSNSPMFHIAIGGASSDVTVRNVTIRAPASDAAVNPSHNTDACDVSAKHVLVDSCDVSVGDDDFTCGGGTSDVLIRNCKYGYGHGVSIGSPTRGGVSNLRVIDCTFDNTESGIRIKSDRDRGGDISNLEYRNLTMHNVGIPILIYGSYNAKVKMFRQLNDLTGENALTYTSAPVTPLTPIYHNILFSDINATTRSGSRDGLIWGLPEAPVSNLTLRRVKISGDGTFGIFTASHVHLEQCSFTTRDGKNALSTAGVSDLVTQP